MEVGKNLAESRHLRAKALALGVALALGSAVAAAQQPAAQAAPAQPSQQATAEQPEEILVFGRSMELVGTAEAASEGTISGADLLVRPMVRVAEVLEAVPGTVAVQHSGSGKANQWFLRGFNLDHGTDFTAIVDGMPMNLRTHGHGQGYLDVNGMMPETIERIDYRKGPYRADLGDFSMAGAGLITTIDGLDAPFVSLEGGDEGWGRIAGGGTANLDDDSSLTAMAELKTYDGPWEQPEDLEHFSMWGNYRRNTDFGTLGVTLSGYDAHWIPTEQIPERAIGTSVCEDAFCALDPTSTGDTERWILSAKADADRWSGSAYAQYYNWTMSSNPTYDAQINQFDKRSTMGGRFEYTAIDSAAVNLNVGTELRNDHISNVGLDEYEAGQFIANISQNSVTETSVAAFTEVSLAPTDRLRVLLGLRGDTYDFDVIAKTDGSAEGNANDSRVSPKLGLAYQIGNDVELYANWGEGFHSNDARGVVNADDPVPGLSAGEGQEVGARFQFGALTVTGALWWLDLDSELIFVGDSNAVEPKGGSERDGYELTFFWQPVDWLGIDAVWAESDARYVDNPDGPYVEGAIESAGQIGISAIKDKWEASLRIRHLGEYALTADNAHRAESSTNTSLRGAYTAGRATFYAEVYNIFDEDGKDITYWYEAYVDGLDPPGLTSEDIDCEVTNCRISRVEAPRSLRVGVKFEF
jgi:outer membrane receptor protein involved in Fe transport